MDGTVVHQPFIQLLRPIMKGRLAPSQPDVFSLPEVPNQDGNVRLVGQSTLILELI